MTEPGWAQILTQIYHNGATIETPHDLSDISQNHIFVKQTEVEPAEVEEALLFLRNQDLIKIDEDEANHEGEDKETARRKIQLRPEGFQVAHDRELSYKENAGNVAVAGLTAVLAFTAFAEVIIAYASGEWDLVEIVSLGFLLIAVGWITLYIWNRLIQAGALNIDELIDRQNRHDK